MVKTTKGGKVMNPTDAYRKELRKKELKRVWFSPLFPFNFHLLSFLFKILGFAFWTFNSIRSFAIFCGLKELVYCLLSPYLQLLNLGVIWTNWRNVCYIVRAWIKAKWYHRCKTLIVSRFRNFFFVEMLIWLWRLPLRRRLLTCKFEGFG